MRLRAAGLAPSPQSLESTAYDSVPGARYQYSNIGYGALGLALSKAAGRPFRELVQTEVFDPHGGVYSTVADLGRFLGAVAGVPGLRILSETSRQEMTSVQTPEETNRGYGLGLSILIDEDGDQIVGHGGSVAGYTAHMAVDPGTRIGVVLLRNYQNGATNLGRAAHGLVARLSALSPVMDRRRLVLDYCALREAQQPNPSRRRPSINVWLLLWHVSRDVLDFGRASGYLALGAPLGRAPFR